MAIEMNKRPSLQFYPADWLKATDLQMCSMNTIGIWINIICRMWETKEEGILQGKAGEIALLVGAKPGEFKRFMKEAKEHNFCDLLQDVTDSHTIVTIRCRRMNRLFLEREGAKHRMRRHREVGSNVNVTTPSSTSSSTTKNIYDIFRKYYPGEKRGLETEFNYFCKTHKDWKDVLPLLLPAVKGAEVRRSALRSANQFVPPWKHLKTWIYNRCWEVTSGKFIAPEEQQASEQQALEKKRQDMRAEYSKIYQDKSTEELEVMVKSDTLITHRWLIAEILEKRNKLKA